VDKKWEEILISAAKSGLEHRIQYFSDKYSLERYYKRLNQELDCICSNGLAEYFVVIGEIADWIAKNKFTLGPGRGLAPSSLVCYALGITHVDPIQLGLLPEIFMDRIKKHIPNIMIDLCFDIRAEIYRYLNTSYSLNWIIGCCSIQNETLISLSKDSTYNHSPLSANRENNHKDQQLIGDVSWICCEFSGQKFMSVDRRAGALAKKRGKSAPDLNEIPLYDSDTLSLFDAADTKNIVNFENQGIRNLLKKCAPNSFDDIATINAIYRPGSIKSGIVDEFIARKNGIEAMHYHHPLLKPILQKTLGLIVYQEQIIEIAQSIGGYTSKEANDLRKALLKKNISARNVTAQKIQFFQRAARQRIDTKTAEIIFEDLERSAGSAFIKSHNIAYTILSYQSAYLKAHYPAEFEEAYDETYYCHTRLG
jgi:DNA polymerase III alpha subunit